MVLAHFTQQNSTYTHKKQRQINIKSSLKINTPIKNRGIKLKH
ncbi:hypothetical protein BC749_104224 [Flavobacterium araucananum]|nr:hypothetical protein BC749_104224 [Flavobacterium araucananum]